MLRLLTTRSIREKWTKERHHHEMYEVAVKAKLTMNKTEFGHFREELDLQLERRGRYEARVAIDAFRARPVDEEAAVEATAEADKEAADRSKRRPTRLDSILKLP